jgi:hypothetical protein
MLQNTNIPKEANVLLLPVDFHLTESTCDLKATLETKDLLNEIFMSYLLMVDHGGEFSSETKDKIYCLNQSLQAIVDLMATQNTH